MVQPSTLIDTATDLNVFFRSIVADTVRRHDDPPSEAIELYLAALLADYARPGALPRDVLDVPIAQIYREAVSAEGSERFERLRRMGDEVLYVAGFFRDHLGRKGIEASFVTEFGSRAYDAAGAMLRGSGTGSVGPDVFSELADRFARLTLVLRDVSETLTARAARTPKDVVDLYGRYLESGSACLAGELARWGFVVPRRGSIH